MANIDLSKWSEHLTPQATNPFFETCISKANVELTEPDYYIIRITPKPNQHGTVKEFFIPEIKRLGLKPSKLLSGHSQIWAIPLKFIQLQSDAEELANELRKWSPIDLTGPKSGSDAYLANQF